jgi:hypothetical protein
MSEREHDEPLSHGAPDEVTLLLGELKEVDPPAGLAGTVMSRISSQAPARVRRLEPIQLRVGQSMAKKVLWSVMGAAAVVLIGLKLAGYPPPSEGTEGTIGAAQRYQSQQISDKDVKLNDAELQKFMQSDTFQKLISNKAARQALANKELQKALANDEVRKALASEDVRHALASEDVRHALASDEVRHALASDEVRKALASEDVRKALMSDDLKKALASDEARNALTNDGLRQAVSADGFAAALDAAAGARTN